MRLAFIFNNSHVDTWSTPGGLSTSLRTCGHDVDHYDLKKPNEVLNLSKKHEFYDAVCLWEAGTILDSIADIWQKENFKNTLMMAESGDDPQIFGYNLKHTLPADIVLTPDHDSFNEYKRIGKNAFWMTHWGDEIVWKKCPERDTGKISTSAGPRAGMWKNLMHILTTSFSEDFINPMMQGGRYISVEENVNLYDNSDIVVQVSSNKEITRRIFEASVCGRLVVTDRLSSSKKLNECLIEDEHIVLYDSLEECQEKIKMFLKEKDRRKKIARQAYNHVIKNHSSRSRAEFLLNIINKNI